MCVCVCTRAWACACECVHVALLIQHAIRMRYIVKSLVVSLAPPYFSTLSHINGTIFEGEKLFNMKRVF
jgi:hypothetical protein